MRAGDDARALVAFRRRSMLPSGDSTAAFGTSSWRRSTPTAIATSSTGSHATIRHGGRAFFRTRVRERRELGALQAMYATRVEPAQATVDERRCLIDRLQRDGHWANAYRVLAERLAAPTQRTTPGSRLQRRFRAAAVESGIRLARAGAAGRRGSHSIRRRRDGRSALSVAFVRQRYGGPPVYQYLLLVARALSAGGPGSRRSRILARVAVGHLLQRPAATPNAAACPQRCVYRDVELAGIPRANSSCRRIARSRSQARARESQARCQAHPEPSS